MTIKERADRLLSETGLVERLRKHGKVYITGSYYMDLMAWNDLDVYLQTDDSFFDMYSMISEVNSALLPCRFDGIVMPERPALFYGCETMISGERWNIDIWIKDEKSIRESFSCCDRILRSLSADPKKRQLITEIKQGLIEKGMYGFDKDPQRHYHSHDIYSAVLDEGILSLAEFLERHPV